MDPNFALSEEEKDALRKKRHLGLRKLGSLGLIILGFCFLAFVIGIASIVVQAEDPTPPYMLGLALIAGVIMLPSGIVAVLAARKGRDEEEVSSAVIVFFVFCVIAVTFCVLIMLGGGVLGIVLCSLDDEKIEHLCEPNHDANVALSVLTLLVSLVLFILSIMGSCFLCLYGRTFGFKSRYEQRMEMQVRRMQAMQAQGQQVNLQYNQQFSQGGMSNSAFKYP
ncbi:hypothetical protein BaRGS_00029742 [Batillaria attramentaria]|uniref:Tetraspanin n=1 Tax=Batillaria attramentaria TaxID=370345 RepID=A0ABD0JW83_9CAEN